MSFLPAFRPLVFTGIAFLVGLLPSVPYSVGAESWVPWSPEPDTFQASPLDLRHLNESQAGHQGRILARGEKFVHEATGKPVRFWAVNGPPHELRGPALTHSLRQLAKRGVNLVRIHSGVYDETTGIVRPEVAAHKHAIVRAAKTEGIYSLLSIYFPLWLKPADGPGWREGYDGTRHPFALLFFESEFQQHYREWWRTLLTTPDASGHRLIDEPALFALELINEDSLFFWTFNDQNIPEPQRQKLERRFADWAATRHGSLENALAAWSQTRHPRDRLADRRLGFRPLFDLFTHRTPRDRDTAAFLYELQRDFYRDTIAFLRNELGYRGLITASNWVTANESILGPLEKLSYLEGDFIDRHGYFGSNHAGESAAWSLRPGHTYSDVSALRFAAQDPAAPRRFANPVMDPMYNLKPSMLSETTWNRPNRHRGEAPVVLAVYGALQDSDSIVHFAHDGAAWQVKPRFWMQPWTLMAPTQLGQLPATALIYRQGLVKTGDLMADLPLKISDALALRGTPLAQAAHLDELRKSDIGPRSAAERPDAASFDPLVHFTGRTNVRFTSDETRPVVRDFGRLIDRKAMTVTSSTGELHLDYGRGILRIDAPAAQGISGHLSAAGRVELSEVTLASDLEVGHLLVVALDGQPLATSERILVQAMSEERPSGFATEATDKPGVLKITAIGRDPWLIRALQGTVSFKRPDADRLRVTALDFNGYPVESIGAATTFTLRPDRAYYLIAR